MKKAKGRMDESILVCVYYGPNGERLIKRGAKIATMLDCPLYVLTVDALPYDELDAEKSAYVDRWKELSEEYDAEEFIVRDNEKKPAVKVIAEVAREHHITQIIIGQTAKSRWEEITKGSFMNVLLREIPFVDFHVVSCDRAIKGLEGHFEKGCRAYLVEDEEGYAIMFSHTNKAKYEGIFFKETGTDFNNGIFKFMKHNRMIQVHVTDDRVTEPTKIYPTLREEKLHK
ncbi:universal stress protein [Shouchella lehensis]|uniref:Histidine kinase n=1 Tax=Shouchella lehensis TaxID=300825 RepID=A0A4Y7WEZ4_9BACI|nr:universal stress protein [Shouchella lehensis]MBG9784778.1 histidine kinase [Shouchella lehensis]TES46183.1 histidine kinase [Shouchella lehensis]